VRILLTNDDGLQAEGLQALRRELDRRQRFDVYVAAPERERSAVGHAITVHKPLRVTEVVLPGATRPAWSVSGTPADSTKLAVLALMPERPDIVVSGINRGANVGGDVLYSGTVSAAIEAVMLGIPAIAVSLAGFEGLDFGPAARFTAELIGRLPEAPLPERPYLLNVNVPALPAERIAGVASTRLGARYYEDAFERRTDPRGRAYYWLAGEVRDPGPAEPGTDIWALAQGLISITPLQIALTDEPLRARLAAWAAGLRPEAG
jgi:5'-nucleotidase